MNEYEHRRRPEEKQGVPPQRNRSARQRGSQRQSGSSTQYSRNQRLEGQQPRRRAPGENSSRRARTANAAGASASYRRRSGLDECLALEEENERDYQEYLERKRRRAIQRRREEQLRKQKIELIKKLTVIGIAVIGLCFLGYNLFFSNPVAKTVTVEAGTKDLKVSDFLKKKKVDAEFVTDMSKVDLNHVGEQEIVIKAKGKERKSKLIVKDTTPPKAKAENITIDIDGKLKAKELVADIQDATDVKCSFEDKPDLSKKGKVSAVVILTDEGGNTAKVQAEIKVIEDKEAPEINGVAPLTGFAGDPISYKSEITVTDNCDKKVKLEIDNSDVNPEEPGTYDVIYTAQDRAGNKAQEETTITIKEKPEDYVEPEEVEKEADEILAEITDEDMTQKEKARAIYDWTRTNIGYVNSSEKESWTNGAHQGFTTRQGDCFIFFATAKALLTQAGIPNLDIEKSDTSHSRHYWSLVDVGDGWYHFDTTPRQGGGEFFLLTDEEILDYSKAHNNSHIFDQSKYPATPTEDSSVD